MNRLSYCCTLLFFASALLIGGSPNAHAQNQDVDELGNALNNIGETYAENYTQPVTDALGGGLNAGLFRTASFDGTGLIPGLDLYVGVAAMGTFTAGSDDSFRLDNETVNTEGGGTLELIYPNEDLPTVIGSEEQPEDAEIVARGPRGTELQRDEFQLPPGLLDASIAPLAVPQVGIGTIYGTDAQIRYVPSTNINNYGSISVFGLAVRHSVSQYIPASPVDLAVQGSWQSVGIDGANEDDLLEISGWALNGQVSKDVPVIPLTLYGGVQYEKTTTDVEFTYSALGETTTISLSQEAQNNFRAVGGVSLTLLFLKVNADYAVGANNVASVGVGLVL